jgi:hypothetical protein
MNIEIHDPALEARIQRQIHATGAASAEEALLGEGIPEDRLDAYLTELKARPE